MRIRINEKRRKRTVRFAELLFFVSVSFVSIVVTTYAQDLNLLSEKLRSGNNEEKRDVLMKLRSLRSEEASRIAVAALRDKNPMVRATAASTITFLPKAEVSAALLPLLKDKDEFVRREAAYALGEVGDPSSAPQLISSLATDNSPEVRTAAAVAIGKVGNPAAVASLIGVLAQPPTEENEMLRRAAARSIGQIAQIMRTGNVSVLTPQNFLPDNFKDIRSKPSPDLLSYFRNAVSTLMRALDNASEADDTRREAAFALGAIGDKSAEAVLSKYTSSSDVYLAEISKEALLKLRAVE